MKKNDFNSLLPLFTVIIPVRNRSTYLYHTLRTCSNQDYENLEIIVSDDYSTDDTKEMLMAFIKLDPRIKYVRPSEVKNVGMLENFEFALNLMVDGQYYCGNLEISELMDVPQFYLIL